LDRLDQLFASTTAQEATPTRQRLQWPTSG
jgi:hypothetical protein